MEEWVVFLLFNFLLIKSASAGLSETTELLQPTLNNNNNNNIEIVRHRDFDKFDLPPRYCQKPAKCQPLATRTCMGAKLPYHWTTLELTDLTSQEKVAEKLHQFEYLRHMPKCWAVIQPFLCALYMPKCVNGTMGVNGTMDLPSREMCRITLEPCKLFYNNSLIMFLNCDDGIFPSKCKNDVLEMRFNTTGTCMDPLVKTEQDESFYPDVEGCGLRCKDSLYTEDEHNQIRKLILSCALFCFLCNLFTIITFVIEWRAANKYPVVAVFYMNVCYSISCCGWFIQFLGSEYRDDIVCQKDGTLRKSEPNASQNLTCVTVFVMIYYFLIASLLWFVIFTYSWYRSSLQALGKSYEHVDKKRTYFHSIAWSGPLVLTIFILAVEKIDGDYVTGICTVGVFSFWYRFALLLVPGMGAVGVASYNVFRGLILLAKVRRDSHDIISVKTSRKIRWSIVRMGLFILFMAVCCVVTVVYDFYVWAHTDLWSSSLHNYLSCKLTIGLSADYSARCRQDSRPSVAMLQLQLLAVFGTGVTMASCSWSQSSIKKWTRYIRKKFRLEVEVQPIKIRKHEVIAQTIAQIIKFKEGGLISVGGVRYSDPMMNFELNSIGSNELSKTFVRYLPRLVNRRDAIVYYSSDLAPSYTDSEMSVSVRQVSFESRVNSAESQLSVLVSEWTATRRLKKRGRDRRKHAKRRRHSRDTSLKKTSKTRSNASLDSHLRLIDILTNSGEGVQSQGPNLKRRNGNAGLEGSIPALEGATANKLVPYNKNMNHIISGSEDENVSVTYSEFNMVVTNNTNLNLGDQLVLKSLRQDFKIEEPESSSSEDEDSVSQNDEERQALKSGRESHSSRKSSNRRKSNNSDSEAEAEQLL